MAGRHQSLLWICLHFGSKSSLMAFMKGMVSRYWSGDTLVVPATAMAKSFVILPDLMTAMTDSCSQQAANVSK